MKTKKKKNHRCFLKLARIVCVAPLFLIKLSLKKIKKNGCSEIKLKENHVYYDKKKVTNIFKA